MADSWLPIELSAPLADSACVDRWSVLVGEPVVVVDLREPGPPLEGPALDRLTKLAAVSVGRVPEMSSVPGSFEELATRLDVLVAGEEELTRVRRAVEAHPLASLGLVQALRLGDRTSIEEGLVVESLLYATLQAGPEFAGWLAQRGSPRVAAEATAPLRTERAGGHLRVWLDRSHKRNAFSASMRDALCEVLELVHQDPSIEEVELRGAGPSFCSGGDLDEFGTAPDPATAHAIRSIRNPGRLLAGVAGRVRAHLHGACVGAGVELPAFCGRVTAQADAFFQLPEVGMGLIPGAGGTVSLPRRIGRQRTAWMALTGVRVSAVEALRWGLVDAIEDAP